MMNNKEISRQFLLLGKLMEIHGENPFKIRSYINVADIIETLPEELNTSTAAEWKKIPGIGEAITAKIAMLLETGQLPQLHLLLEKTPPGILEMAAIKGIGPKKVVLLWKELDICSPGELLYACEENRLSALKGFGSKTQAAIHKAVQYYLQTKGNLLWAEAEVQALPLLKDLQDAFPAQKTALAGAFIRQMEIVHRLDIVTTITQRDLQPWLEKQFYRATSAQMFVHDSRLPVAICYTTPNSFGKEMIVSGSSLVFSEALFQITTHADAEDEASFFKFAGLPFIPAALREEPEQLKETVPDLLKPEDIRGLIHCHSTWSDGADTIEAMAHAAIQAGWAYMLITDHSRSAGYAGGLSIARLQEQWEEIDLLNKKLEPFIIFKGIESDILTEGQLDYPEEILAGFDLVIASVHQHLTMDEPRAMMRLTNAISNPYTSILGHLTGRLLLSRPGYPVDHEAIIKACAANEVAIEINAHPRRLDMDWRFVKQALKQKILLSVNPDAHSTKGQQDVRYGVLTAQKGGLTARQNLSSFTLPEMQAFILRQQAKRKQ